MAKYPLFNANPQLHPEQFMEAVNRTKAYILGADEKTVHEGSIWYPSVREATQKGSRDIGISPTHGSGIVAAVSPNMDFDNNNIHAFGELSTLQPVEKAMIRESARQSKENTSFNRLLEQSHRLRGETVPEGMLKPTGRIPEVRSMLIERAPSVSPAPDTNIVKALDIMEGAHPDDVLDRRTAPKVNAFYRNINGDRSVATIDGREADMSMNMMRPWTGNRGINSASLPSGKPTRYEDHEEILRTALPDINKSSRIRSFTGGRGLDIAGAQAVKWLVGKQIERTRPDGTVMKQGPARKGQPYI